MKPIIEWYPVSAILHGGFSSVRFAIAFYLSLCIGFCLGLFLSVIPEMIQEGLFSMLPSALVEFMWAIFVFPLPYLVSFFVPWSILLKAACFLLSIFLFYSEEVNPRLLLIGAIFSLAVMDGIICANYIS